MPFGKTLDAFRNVSERHIALNSQEHRPAFERDHQFGDNKHLIRPLTHIFSQSQWVMVANGEGMHQTRIVLKAIRGNGNRHRYPSHL